MLYAILAAVLVALDQLVKYLVVQNIPLGEHVPFLPYLLGPPSPCSPTTPGFSPSSPW